MKTINSNYLEKLMSKILKENLGQNTNVIVSKIKSALKENKGICECGGNVYEGECSSCGKEVVGEGFTEIEDIDTGENFDYVEEQEMSVEDDVTSEVESENEEACKYHKEHFGPDDEMTKKFCGTSLTENEKRRLRRKDRFKNKEEDNKVETTDKPERTMKFKERYGMEENKVPVKKPIRMTENQVVEMIEKIIKEQKEKVKDSDVKNNLKSIGSAPGLETYKSVHKKSGKENSDNITSVSKKMKEYLQDGSKGEYSTNPKIFPKGNGELAKMDKKAYVPSGAVEDYIDNFTAAGLENLDYDEINPNEEWVSDNVEGSSRTGNNPDWANTGESDVNKKRNTIRKNNLLGKLKRKAYNKAPQPVVNDSSGEDEGSKIMTKLESTSTKNDLLINEEFKRIQQLLDYNKRTQ